MPPDERITKSTEIQKITSRYQDVNKNEVKFRGKIPVNVEHENNKQKMEILITERTDITPSLGMDWMKKFKLTISKIQLAENNQSEREKVFNKFPDLFENNETIKDTEINIQLKPGKLPKWIVKTFTTGRHTGNYGDYPQTEQQPRDVPTSRTKKSTIPARNITTPVRPKHTTDSICPIKT